jgi:hypothetical protein
MIAANFQPKTKRQVHDCLKDKHWRMNNLWTIVDESGVKRPYRRRAVQSTYARSRHGMDVILKSRQHGFSTETDLDGRFTVWHHSPY